MTGNDRTTNAVPRCPRGHIIVPHREYRCPDCRVPLGPCRCELFDHVVSMQGEVMANGKRHRRVWVILGGGYRVTYNRDAVERDE